MSRFKLAGAKASDLMDSDSEYTRLAPSRVQRYDFDAENSAPLPRGYMRSKNVSKVTKAKTQPRPQKRRLALTDKTNHSESFSDDDLVGGNEQMTRANALMSDDELDASEVELVDPTINRGQKTDSRERLQPSSRKRQRDQRQRQSEEIPETQSDVEMDADELVEGPIRSYPSKRYGSHEPVSKQQRVRQGSFSHSTRPFRRAGSASDTERHDPTTRRKLGEMTRKYDGLEMKYQQLREVGLKEAEQNFDALLKQSEAKSKAAEDFIASLKADMAAQTALVNEARSLQKQVAARDAEVASLKAQVAELSNTHVESQKETKILAAQLSEAQTENKSLSAKVAALRAGNETGKNATHAAVVNGAVRHMGSAEAAQAAQIAQLKEDLYSDLTGLIIRSVKREQDEDVYDCIQTGRNGTLHFKLAITNDPGSDSYDDSEFTYKPQLDEGRDRELMDILPDYLQEEITFTRPQCSRFYVRVIKCLMERP